MHIAITGASGFVGPKLIQRLAGAGHTGHAISRHVPASLPRGWDSVRREDALRCRTRSGQNRRLDWLVHLEVKQHVESPTAEDLGEFQKVNVEGTREWLRWCTEHEVPGFVYFSTIKAVGESPHAQDEQTATVPTTPYGESKRMAEQLVHAWAAERATRFVLILRPAVIYGPGNRANVFSMVRAIDRGRFFLVGRNDNVKSLISIANVAAAVEHLMGRAAPGAEIYNLVDPVSYPVRDIVRMTASLLGKRSVPSLPYGAARLIASTSEALFRLSGRNLPLNRSRLTALRETTHFDGAKLLASGFVHPQSTEDGLAEMVEWYRTC